MSEMNNVVEAFSDEEMEDYAAIFTRFINGLCRFADRHNYDRDNIMKYTAQRFSVFAEITTVENLVLKEAPTIDPVKQFANELINRLNNNASRYVGGICNGRFYPETELFDVDEVYEIIDRVLDGVPEDEGARMDKE